MHSSKKGIACAINAWWSTYIVRQFKLTKKHICRQCNIKQTLTTTPLWHLHDIMELKGNAPGDKGYKHNNCSRSFAYVYFGNVFDNRILQPIYNYDLALLWNVCFMYMDYTQVIQLIFKKFCLTLYRHSIEQNIEKIRSAEALVCRYKGIC